ncbi:MAG: hypothetical protein JWN79_405, partial [Gemmatimonadetes bacterium]|nr:hypothetical protein [Gemmatimonadota bacterium]
MHTGRGIFRTTLHGALLVPALLGAAQAQNAAQQAALATLIPVQAGTTVDHDSVTVGDVVRLTVRVRGPLGATVNFPTGLDSLGPVQSLEPPRVVNGADSLRAADRIAVYRVAAWDVGAQPIRLGDVLVQTDEGERHIALSLPSLFVKSVLPADTTQRTPKPARALLTVRTPLAWWWWAVAAAAALLVGLGVWWWMRRRRGAVGPVGDPYADAQRDFERVERLGLVAAGEAGRHAVLMTDILRRYLAARLEAATLAQTSGELLRALRGAPTVDHDRLEQLLATVDRVKFAAAPLGAEQARSTGAEARALV